MAGDLDPELVRPGEQRPCLGHDLGRARDRPVEDLAGGAIDRDDVTGIEDAVADDDPAVADLDPGRTDDGGDPPASGDDRGVARQAAARGQDAGRAGHPVDVIG